MGRVWESHLGAMETVNTLGTYDHIEVEYELPDCSYHTVKGQFRGRIKDIEHCYYDWTGSAIWVTSDNGFEAFIAIDSLIQIKVLEKYNG